MTTTINDIDLRVSVGLQEMAIACRYYGRFVVGSPNAPIDADSIIEIGKIARIVQHRHNRRHYDFMKGICSGPDEGYN